MPVQDFVLRGMLDELERTSDYQARRAEIARWNAGSPLLKRGIALTPVKFGISFTLTWLNQAGALVHVYQDGSIRLNHGGTEMGQGLFLKVAQVAASVFGVDVGQVKITATDTAKVPNTSATAASSGSDMNGMATQAACITIRDRLAGFIADRHQADALALQEAGAFGVVLEMVPAQLAKEITKALKIPTIGIGAGPRCDGQVLVWSDMAGMTEWTPSFARRFGELGAELQRAAAEYVGAVKKGSFPGPDNYRVQ